MIKQVDSRFAGDRLETHNRIVASVHAGRNSPLGPSVEALTAGLDCSPCWRRSGCARNTECMRAIRPARVLEAAARLTGRAPPREDGP